MNVLQNVIEERGEHADFLIRLGNSLPHLSRNIITVRVLIQVADGSVESRTMPQSFSDCEISNIKHNLLQQSVAFLKSV